MLRYWGWSGRNRSLLLTMRTCCRKSSISSSIIILAICPHFWHSLCRWYCWKDSAHISRSPIHLGTFSSLHAHILKQNTHNNKPPKTHQQWCTYPFSIVPVLSLDLRNCVNTLVCSWICVEVKELCCWCTIVVEKNIKGKRWKLWSLRARDLLYY